MRPEAPQSPDVEPIALEIERARALRRVQDGSVMLAADERALAELWKSRPAPGDTPCGDAVAERYFTLIVPFIPAS